eukprot:5679519-Pyramimonas_sp.AAC.2
MSACAEPRTSFVVVKAIQFRRIESQSDAGSAGIFSRRTNQRGRLCCRRLPSLGPSPPDVLELLGILGILGILGVLLDVIGSQNPLKGDGA